MQQKKNNLTPKNNNHFGLWSVVSIKALHGVHDRASARQKRERQRQKGGDECAGPLAAEINGGAGEDSSLLH